VSSRTLGILYMLTTVVLWGVSFVATKVLVGIMPPLTAAFLRFVIATAILYIIVRKPLSYGKKDRIYVILAGLFGITLYFLFENSALRITTATSGALIVNSTPVIYLVAADILRRKRSPWIRYIGTLLAFIGVSIIVLGGRFVLHLNPLGDLLMFGAALSWVFYTIFVERVKDYDSLPLTRDISLWGTLFLLPLALLEVSRTGVFLSAWFTPSAWIALLYLGIFCSALGYLLWNKAISLAGGKTVTSGLYFIPVVTAIAEAIILKEPIHLYTVVGAILTIGGTYLAEQGGDV